MMDILTKKRIQRFHRQVNEHTAEVLDKFGRVGGTDLEDHSREEQIVVLVEEVGKLARASNKMRICSDDAVHSDWKAEYRHRLMTIASVVSRLAVL